jgi:hypothetical protein
MLFSCLKDQIKDLLKPVIHTKKNSFQYFLNFFTFVKLPIKIINEVTIFQIVVTFESIEML